MTSTEIQTVKQEPNVYNYDSNKWLLMGKENRKTTTMAHGYDEKNNSAFCCVSLFLCFQVWLSDS